MTARHNYLFSGRAVFEVIEDLQNRAMNHLRGLNEDSILATPTNDLVASLLAQFGIDMPELHTSETWVDEREITQEIPIRGYDVYSDRTGGTRKITVHTTSFHVPFSGNGSLFQVAPSSRSLPGPLATISGQELVITLEINQMTAENVQQSYKTEIQNITQHLSTLRNDFQQVSKNIESAAKPYIEQRKAQLLKSKNLVASLGFPMKRRSDAPTTYRAPEVRRKLAPAKIQTTAPFKPEPALSEVEYTHILDVIGNMAKVMERSPHVFHSVPEEDLRQHFLVQLNGQYEGQATGETFNFQGKTDILIRSDGANIFIAECKFWHGEKVFVETIDQLL